MNPAGRPLSPAVIDALTYWPGIVHAVAPTPVDLGVLPPLFNELLDQWPWWDQAWRVTQVEPARPCEIARDEPRAVSKFTEVTVPGTVSRNAGDTLPLSARVRFSDDRLIRFQAKVGEVVIGPGSTAAGVPERHPFGSVLATLMDLRGISIREMAIQCRRSMSTIHMLRSGSWNPQRILVAELAEALGMSEEDLLTIAGLDVDP